MPDQPQTPPARFGLYRAGWAMSGLAIAFLLMDASMKLLALPVVLERGRMRPWKSEREFKPEHAGCNWLRAIRVRPTWGPVTLRWGDRILRISCPVATDEILTELIESAVANLLASLSHET